VDGTGRLLDEERDEDEYFPRLPYPTLEYRFADMQVSVQSGKTGMPARDDKGHWLPGVSVTQTGDHGYFHAHISREIQRRRDCTGSGGQVARDGGRGKPSALMYVMDRNIGKPRQAMDIVADVNEAVGLTIVRAGDDRDTSTDTAST